MHDLRDCIVYFLAGLEPFRPSSVGVRTTAITQVDKGFSAIDPSEIDHSHRVPASRRSSHCSSGVTMCGVAEF
jgi:hypothetical protein